MTTLLPTLQNSPGKPRRLLSTTIIAIAVTAELILTGCTPTIDGSGFDDDKADNLGEQSQLEIVSASLQWYSGGAGELGYADESWEKIVLNARNLMDRVEGGKLSGADERQVREQVIPFLASLMRGRAVANSFENMCSEVQPGSLLAPTLNAMSVQQQKWEGSAADGWSQILDQAEHASLKIDVSSNATENGFEEELLIESAVSSLMTVAHMRASLVEGEPTRMRGADYADRMVSNVMGGTLRELQTKISQRLAERIMTIVETMDDVEAARLRLETVHGISTVIETLRSNADYRNTELGGNLGRQARERVERECKKGLKTYAAVQPLLFSDTASDRICPFAARDYLPTTGELGDYVEGMRPSIDAYMEQLASAWEAPLDERGALLAHRNLSNLGAVLSRCPECAEQACTALRQARLDEESARFWDDVVIWGTAILGAAAALTGIGGLIFGASAALWGTTVGAIASLTALATAAASIPAAAYLGYRSSRLLSEARRDMLAALVTMDEEGRTAQIETLKRDQAYAERLVLEAVLTGTLGIVEVALMMRFARAAISAQGLTTTERFRSLVDQSVLMKATWHQHNKALRELLESRGAKWSSRAIVNDAPESAAEVRELVRRAMDESDPLFKEVDDFLRAGGVDDTTLWTKYFQSYDNMLLYSRDYQALASHANFALPKNGIIYDLGAGTGNFTTTLSKAAPGRKMVAFESSDGGVAVIRKKLSQLFGDNHSHRVIQGDLTTATSIAEGADGAVMNNVLYTLGDQGEQVLSTVARDLKPGAVMYLNDPIPAVAGAANVQSFISRLAVDAFEAGAPMTAHDIAVIAAVNSGRLVQSSAGATLRSVTELRDLVGRVGFDIIDEGHAYTGNTYTMILRKR